MPFSLCLEPDMEGCYTIPCMLEEGPPRPTRSLRKSIYVPAAKIELFAFRLIYVLLPIFSTSAPLYWVLFNGHRRSPCMESRIQDLPAASQPTFQLLFS